MTTIHAEELRPGDVVDYQGQRHVVRRIHRQRSSSWPVACDDAGWAMALGHTLIAVHRPV
jgi:hypothetical protein